MTAPSLACVGVDSPPLPALALSLVLRGVLLSVFAAVCLPVCANTAVPETRATVFATHTGTGVSEFATHHGARIWPRAGHSRPRPAHGTHRRPSLARRPTRLGRASAGRPGTAGPEPDVVEVEPSSKAKSVKWSEGRLMLLYAGLMHATRALRVRTLAGRVIVLARLAHCCE